jgi:hypothetical protein
MSAVVSAMLPSSNGGGRRGRQDQPGPHGATCRDVTTALLPCDLF